MKSATSLYLFLCLFAFSSHSFASSIDNGNVTIKCTLTNCQAQDSLFLWEFNGVTFQKIESVALENETATFELPSSDPKFVYVGLAANNNRPIIVGMEEQVEMISDCKGFRKAKINNSEANTGYEELKVKMNSIKQRFRSLMTQYQRNMKDEAKIQSINAQLKELDTEKLGLLETTKFKSPYLASVVALNTYLSYQNYGSAYNNEIEYFGNEYFKHVDWKDNNLSFNPWVYESMKAYSATLSSIKLPQQIHQQFIENQLKRIPEDQRAYQLALSGVLAGLKEKSNANYGYFAKIFIAKFKDSSPIAVKSIQASMKALKGLTAGGEAPDFTMNQVDGTPLSLKELRGKVVLVDFWASWCGPCRRENPNVVKLYEKYKDKGFDILGVSLDKGQAKWEAAIEKDGLKWHHVSDLKGWQNSAAKLYGVRSIPHTVLLDKEGKIIARNLRGPSLEQKLAEIFGEQ